jgi:hypothetical protein
MTLPANLRFLCYLLAACVTVTASLKAQSTAPDVGSLWVTVTDAASGAPVLRVVLWNSRPSGPQQSVAYYAQADTTGELRLDSIPAGVPQHFQVVCDAGKFEGRQLDTLTAMLAPGEVRHWQVRASTEGCDQRPFLVRRGLFTGHWRYGFEESRFQPCDSLLPEAWVEFTSGARQDSTVQWPSGLDKYYPEVFVRFEGVLVGPWRYGHLGVSHYQLTVSRTLDAAGVSKERCRG